MVVDMRLSIMILFLIAAIVVMAMHQFAVIVIVRVPKSLVVPLADYFAAVVMGNVVVIVGMSHRGMGMLRFLALSLRVLSLVGQRHTFLLPLSCGLRDCPALRQCGPDRPCSNTQGPV